ncbi:McrB family protein [Arthrobacter sp. B1805]|uniref:McrB family protein n=1 Tax=Arthrobacter sp. B1805 TaxID=2058892 RepID=UPI001CA5C129|nr:AAA family ATPase [Arthrobacter sp. B1805]
MSSEAWTQFMSYASRFARSVDLDNEEYFYKLALAERLSRTRQLFLADEAGWPQALVKDVGSSNLIDQWFKMRLTAMARTKPDLLRSAIEVLWIGEPDPGAMSTFGDRLRSADEERIHYGAITMFASVLLLARDPLMCPPYKPQTAKDFLKLVGWADRGINGPPSERYAVFLQSMDQLLHLAPDYGIQLRSRLDAQGLMWTVLNVDPDSTWDADEAKAFREWRGDKVKAQGTERDLLRGSSKAPEVETAAWLILGAGLRGEPSALDNSTTTWTAEAAADLGSRSARTDVGPGSFMAKLERQLAGASRATVLLAAELLYLQVVPLANVTPATKIARIEKVLSWVPGEPVKLTPELEDGLEATGSFNGGVGFNIQVADHIAWLTRFIQHVVAQPMSLIEAALADPWTFIRMTQSVESDWPTIRYSIEYLAWPGYLQPVVKKDHRIRIRNAFAPIIGGPSGGSETDIAKDLHAIQQAQRGDSSDYVEWYLEPYLSEWQTPGEDVGQRAWLVRQSQAGVAMLDTWLTNGFVSTRAQHLGSPAPGASFDEIQAAVNTGYQHIDYSERKARAHEYYRFLSQMKVDDFVLTQFENRLHLGVVTGAAEYVDDETSRLRRSVAWRKAPISNADLTAPLPRLLEEQGSVVDLTDGLSAISDWYSEEDPTEPGTEEEPAAKPQPAVVPQLRPASTELAAKLHVDLESLQEVVRLLQTRQQIVFYGPPGTGKTYLAGKIARYLAGEEHGDHVKTVQFHPSYAYEDFFEGYRPAQTNGDSVGFSLEPGPLRRIAAEASLDGNRDKPYFLIIDEMNRGNLAKIFGELYFLLEYRDQGINLQYNPEKTFVLPPNLFIIGTMNTSDRSIAMVDAAIRRRFAFVELHPQEGMISGMLERFLDADGKPRLRADLLNALNREISLEAGNRDLMIGPSYFMKSHAETDQGLEEIWKYELLPLLEEQYYGRLNRDKVREKFGLQAMLRKSAPETGPVDLAFAAEPSAEGGNPELDRRPGEDLQEKAGDPAFRQPGAQF